MAEYIPTTHQFVCVVNKKIPIPHLMNAIGHMTAGLVDQYRKDTSCMRFRNFIDKDKSVHPSISENGFIILRSDNSNQIRRIRQLLIQKNIRYTDFSQIMVQGTYVDQQNTFDNTAELNIEYFGVCFFLDKELSKQLTSKFSLYVG